MSDKCKECKRYLKETEIVYRWEAIRYEGFARGMQLGNGRFREELPKRHLTGSAGMNIVCERCFRLQFPNLYDRIDCVMVFDE